MLGSELSYSSDHKELLVRPEIISIKSQFDVCRKHSKERKTKNEGNKSDWPLS